MTETHPVVYVVTAYVQDYSASEWWVEAVFSKRDDAEAKKSVLEAREQEKKAGFVAKSHRISYRETEYAIEEVAFDHLTDAGRDVVRGLLPQP